MGSADKVAGFALGALLDGDRDASHIAQQVPPDFQDAVRACLAEVGRREDKREALAELIRKLRPAAPTLDALPLAARTLLEPARARGTRGQARAARATDPDLIAMLKRLAGQLAEAPSA